KWIDFTPRTVLVALGHAFFTLGIGVGVGISYGAYAPDRIPMGRTVAAVAVFDTLVSLLAGLAIFPIVFALNVAPSMGPGLMFISVPYAFGNIAQGNLYGTLFFVLVTVAALGSVVAILDSLTGMLMQGASWRRLPSVLVVGLVVWLLGLGVIMSLGAWSEVTWFGKWNLFQFLEVVTADFLLPLVALIIAVFVGWRMRPELLRVQLDRETELFFSLWQRCLRYIAPPAIVLVMLVALVT
ncbi:MAG: sodium-dependent transporter, partial [Halieaceae bacterium]|nr:sodium-dependent transporter [Halieaceae bacterium]